MFNPDDLEGKSPDELREIYEKLLSLKKQVDTLYIPHEKQKSFHVSPHKIRAVFGGNRSGKTEMGCNEARFHATGEYPEWYPESQRWNFPTRGRVVVTDFKYGAREVLEPKLKKWFGDKITKIERSMGNISKVHVAHITGGESTFDVMTHEQDTMQFEGWSGHWVWCDEPPPRDKYIASIRGLVDLDGRLWITATPITEPWLYDEIILNTDRDAWHTAVSIYDNPYLQCHVEGCTKKDHPIEAIKAFEVSLTPEEKEARIQGKFLHLSGRIYSELDTNIHLIDRLPEGSQSWQTYFVLDPADRRPHHGIWAKLDHMGNLYVFDELVFKGTIKQTAEQVLLRERTNYINSDTVVRILDPNKGKSPSITTGLKLFQEFGMHGLGFVHNVNDDLATGHLAVRERLSWDKTQPMDGVNHPKIYFIRTKTRECIKQLLAYVWDDWRGKNNSNRSQKEQPKDINKDMPDCVRYLCVYVPMYVLSDKPKRTFLDVDVSDRF